MYIQDEILRDKLKIILTKTTRNQIVKEIQSMGYKFHQYHIDRFISKKQVSIETIKKIDHFIQKSNV